MCKEQIKLIVAHSPDGYAVRFAMYDCDIFGCYADDCFVSCKVLEEPDANYSSFVVMLRQRNLDGIKKLFQMPELSGDILEVIRDFLNGPCRPYEFGSKKPKTKYIIKKDQQQLLQLMKILFSNKYVRRTLKDEIDQFYERYNDMWEKRVFDYALLSLVRQYIDQ